MMIPEPVMTRTGMSIEEFVREFDAAPFELINDERRVIMPHLMGHNLIAGLLYRLLSDLEAHACIVVLYETPFVLADVSDWVKGSFVSDIMVYDQARYDAYVATTTDYLDKPVILIPDLCIEIASKNDEYTEVMAKVEKYMELGVRLVWVFDPYSRTVGVRTLGSQQLTILRDADTVEGGGVVAGFSLRVGDAWAAK
jgi:Uma2 family endonuclease